MNALIPYGTQEFVPKEPELRLVPFNLIPTDAKSLNNDWAEKTFRFAYLFGRQFGSSAWDNENNLQAWIDKALQLQLELRELGVQKAHEKVVMVFREYNIKLPNSNQLPTNMDDVVAIINDKEWYTTDKDMKQQLIHMITYGIFRRGFNHWAVKACTEWLFQHKLKLDDSDINNLSHQKTSRRKKGFVYSNFVQRASNSIADRIQKNMVSNHGEYISVRQKSKGETKMQHRYEKKRFNMFEAYVVYPLNELDNIMSPEDKWKKTIKNNIAQALRNKVTLQDIQAIVDSFGESYTGSTTGKFMNNHIYQRTVHILIFCCFVQIILFTKSHQ